MNIRQLLTLKAAIPSAPRERTVVGNPVSFRTKYAEGMKLVIPFTPVQSGSGTPSPENVRSISGFDSVTVNVTGKNLLNKSDVVESTYVLDDGTTGNSNSFCLTNFIKISGTFTISGYQKRTQSAALCYYDGNFNYLSGVKFASVSPKTLIPPEGAEYIRVSLRVSEIDSYQIENGSAATAYEAFGTAYTVSFPEEAGTVYGGTLIVNDDQTGTLESEWDLISTYDGETLPGEWISDRDVYAVGTTPTTGAQVAYKLAESTTVDLTPDEVVSLIGLNNVWTNTNGQNTVTYIK